MFNEEAYLAQNPDVAAAVRAGKFKSGLDHYNRFGKAEIAKGSRKPVSAAPVASSNPFDSLKQAFTNSDLMQAGLDFDTANPFSSLFDENKIREFWKTKFAPDFQRETNTFNADDASYKRDEKLAFDNNFSALGQNAASNGMLFGGARKAQENQLTTARNNSMDDYVRRLNDAKFNLERSQNRRVDEQVGNEEDLQRQKYEDDKKKYLTGKFNIPGYSV